MWGVQSGIPPQPVLPLLTPQWILLLISMLLILSISIQYFLQNKLNIKSRKEHTTNSLEFSYFYHLSIIVLALSQIQWNMFDLFVWVASYVCVGMLRKAVFIINVERDILINGYGYDNQIVKLLVNSFWVAVFGLVLGVGYVFTVHICFLGIMYKVISMLCFPSLMLGIDSLHLLLISHKTEKHLIYFFNQNINGISPTYKLDLYYKILTYTLKCSHYLNLGLLCTSIIINKVDFLDCLWIVSVIGALYSSSSGLLKTITKYRYMNRFIRGVDRVLRKVKRASDQVCIICMEPLLNSHRLIQCGHLFHYKCLFLWVQTKEECPVCRVRINLNL